MDLEDFKTLIKDIVKRKVKSEDKKKHVVGRMVRHHSFQFEKLADTGEFTVTINPGSNMYQPEWFSQSELVPVGARDRNPGIAVISTIIRLEKALGYYPKEDYERLADMLKAEAAEIEFELKTMERWRDPEPIKETQPKKGN